MQQDTLPEEKLMECDISLQQKNDPNLQSIIAYLQQGRLPTVGKEAQRVVSEALHFSVVDDILYFVNPNSGNRMRVAVPT